MEEQQKLKHVCKFCKKCFPCGRSLGGHIRSHLPKPGYELRENPKKTWRVAHHHDLLLNNNNTSFSSSSTDTENPKSSKMNHIQGKRSSFTRNNSQSSVSEVVEAEQEQEQEQEEVVVAMCLIMLSQDVGSWGDITSSFAAAAADACDDISLSRGNKSRSRKKRDSVSFAANGSKKFESVYLQKELKLKGIGVSANGFCLNDQNDKCFGSKKNREKVQSKESVIGATDYVGKIMKTESAASGYVKNCAKNSEFHVLENGSVSNESKRKIGQSVTCGYVKKGSKMEECEVSENGIFSYDHKNIDDHELDSEFYNDGKADCFKRSKFECTTCNKVFHSYQALGGHRASHKKLLGGLKCSPPLSKLESSNHVTFSSNDQQQSHQEHKQQEQLVSEMVIGSSSTTTATKKVVQKHECPICYRVFPSGQALGGHKRSHLLVAANGDTNGRISQGKINDHHTRIAEVVERLSSSTETRDLLDLNFPPAPVQDETTTTTTTTTATTTTATPSSSTSLVGFIKPYWCVESSHKHEPLLGLISN